jgi:hypothetical protein
MTEQIRNGSANGEEDGRPLLEIKDPRSISGSAGWT